MEKFVGIDVSKARLDWAIHGAEPGSVSIRAPGIRRLVTKLQKLRPTLPRSAR